MPDTPDFFRYLPNSVRLSLQDMGELAVRMGSIISYDRRGEVVWYDDFSHGLSKYTSVLSGTGAAIQLGVSRTGRSGFNMKHVPGTTLTKSVISYTSITLLELSKIGVEIATYFLVAPDYFIVALLNPDGTNRFDYFVKIDLTNRKLYVLDNTNTYVFVSNIPRLDDPDGTIHHFKLIIDTSTDLYVKFQIDSQSYDLSSSTVYSSASSAAPSVLVYFATYGSGLANQASFINHVILTSNEP